MVNPVPGYSVSTPYGRRGPYWSCNRDAYGNGTHTGADYAAPTGTRVVAARPGTAVYCNHGSAFGYHQLEIKCDDGTRDFYAHMPSRAVDNGAWVEAGQTIGKVGAEGNVTGSHLHFERHNVSTGGWSCAVCKDPAPSINYEPAAGSGGSGAGAGGEVEEMPNYAKSNGQVLTLKAKTWTPIPWTSGDPPFSKGNPGLAIKGTYVATLYLRVTNRGGGTVRTDTVEFRDGETVETNPYVSHDKDYIGDTRQGWVSGDGRRLRFRVYCDNPAQLASAVVSVVYWD